MCLGVLHCSESNQLAPDESSQQRSGASDVSSELNDSKGGSSASVDSKELFSSSEFKSFTNNESSSGYTEEYISSETDSVSNPPKEGASSSSSSSSSVNGVEYPVRLEAEAFDKTGGGQNGGADNKSVPTIVRLFETDDWILFESIDFGERAQSLSLSVSTTEVPAIVEFRLDSLGGDPWLTVNVVPTVNWSTYRNQSIALPTVSGVHDVYVTSLTGGSGVDVDYFEIDDSEIKSRGSNLTEFPAIPYDDRVQLYVDIGFEIDLESNGAPGSYFVDSKNGDDRNDGRSEKNAWASHTKIYDVALQPGDVIAFKRGSTFQGPLVVGESGVEGRPITFTAYGAGEQPKFYNPDNQNEYGNCFRIYGSWIIIEQLFFQDTQAPSQGDHDGGIYQTAAVNMREGADHNVVRNNTFINCVKALQLNGEYTLITRNFINGPDKALWYKANLGWTDGWGPMAMQVGIGNQEISYNIIQNYQTYDSPYGSGDGGAIELDDLRKHKDNIYVHHNYSIGNNGFLEASWGWDVDPGGRDTYGPMGLAFNNLVVAFNVSYDYSHFLYLWSPCNECYIDNNTAIRTLPGWTSIAYTFSGWHIRNNVVVDPEWPYYQNHLDLDNNVEINGGEEVVLYEENNWFSFDKGDPRLVNEGVGDFRPQSTSALRNAGLNLSDRYSVDIDGEPLPVNGSWTIGAYQ